MGNGHIPISDTGFDSGDDDLYGPASPTPRHRIPTPPQHFGGDVGHNRNAGLNFSQTGSLFDSFSQFEFFDCQLHLLI